MKTKFIVDQYGRQCTHCEEYKVFSNFHKDPHQYKGYKPRCKDCMKLKKEGKLKKPKPKPKGFHPLAYDFLINRVHLR